MSVLSGYSIEYPLSFPDQATIINKPATLYQESTSPSDESPEHSGQSSNDEDTKRSSVPPTTHTFSLSGGQNKIPLMTVSLHSWASSSKSTPAFVEGQCISGQVELNLRTPDRVKSVSISVEGYYSIPGHEAKTFLQLSETLWDCLMGDPRSSNVFLTESADRHVKLHGKYSWSFKIGFPRTTGVPMKEERRVGYDSLDQERLPPSLRGGHGQVRIGYEVTIRVKRPGLRFGNSLTIPITYMTSTRSSPGSLLRRLAYENRTPAPSVFDDPAGWKVFPEFQVNGSFYRSEVSIACLFALASPLSYARGSFIPCTIMISSFNQRLLEALSSSSAPQVFLRKRLVFCSKLGGELALDGQETIVSKARWLPPLEPSGPRRIMQGEMSIPSSTMPSFTFGRLEMKYDVLILPFDVPGLSSLTVGPLLRSDITVTTFHGEGPLPLSQAS